MDYISTTEAGAAWGLTSARVRTLAREGRIDGARLVGKSWLIPASAKKPLDGRTRESRSSGLEPQMFPLLLFSKSVGGDSAKGLSDEEARLLEAQEAVASCRFEEAISELEDLSANSASAWVRAGALHDLCLCYLALGVHSHFFYYVGELNSLAGQEADEYGPLHLVAANLEVYFKGTEALLAPVPFRYDSSVPSGMWAFLASRSTYAVMVECMKGAGREDILPFETICQELEARGLLYAALSTHLSLAVICFFLNDYVGAESHLLRAANISYEKDYLFPVAVNAAYFSEHLAVVLSAFPEEFASKIASAGKQIHQGYQTIVRALGESHIFAALDRVDFEYVALAVSGLTNKEIAAMKELSVVTVSKRFSAICQKLSVGSKKELVAIAKGAMSRYDIG